MAEAKGRGDRTPLLRVDMDGLPIQGGTSPYVSECRRPARLRPDGHVAIGVAAARLAAGGRAGSVRVLFQPAEEGGGAWAMVAEGAWTGDDRSASLWNELPVDAGRQAGAAHAAVDRLSIVVRGRGGHGGKPHRAADPVVAAAHVITALQTIVSREVPPTQAAVVTVGAIHGGQAFNVIPDEVTLTGTIRTFDAALRRSMPERVTRIASGIAGGLGCTAEVEVRTGNPPVVNDPAVADLARRAAARVVGEAGVVEPEPTMGGEDMAIYSPARAPGCFVRGLRPTPRAA